MLHTRVECYKQHLISLAQTEENTNRFTSLSGKYYATCVVHFTHANNLSMVELQHITDIGR